MASEPVGFESFQHFWDWLEANHAGCDGLWLKLAKKSVPGLTYSEAVEAALCFGWIDGQRKSLDQRHFIQRYTPRRRASPWSRINRDKAEALIEQGRMQPAGRREVEAARVDGRWERAYAGAAAAELPEDLAAALDARPPAREFFDGLDSTNRYAIVWRVCQARRPETRAARIEKYVEMCLRQERLHPSSSKRRPK